MGRRPPRLRRHQRPPASAVALPAEPRLTEAQLTALWQGRRFPAGALVTRTGVPVTVVYQGRPGRGPGPDFRGAVIAGPSGLSLRGDVELHVRSSSFRAHGHATDPAYARVVLHVVFEDDTGVDTPLPGGGTAPIVALAPWVAARAGELRHWLERPLLWREPCHDAVTRMGAEGAGAALQAEGARRFDAHVARFSERIAEAGLDQTLYEGLFAALGYGGNSAAMLALARLLRWPALRDAIGAGTQDERRRRAEAVLLGSAGLMPSQREHRGPVEAYVDHLEEIFRESRLPALPSSSWKLWGVRPGNAPARRIATGAALLASLGAPSALLVLTDALTVRQVSAPFAIEAGPFWRSRHDPCMAPCRLPPACIGRARALEIAVNVVLPVAAASGDAGRAERARALYARLPRPAAYGLTRFLENALASEGVRVPIGAAKRRGCWRCSATGARRAAAGVVRCRKRRDSGAIA